MKQFAILTAALACAACATTAQESETAMPETEAGGFTCDNAGLERFVGMKATAQLGGEAKRLSGARTLRWVPPRTAVTMEFNAERLTVAYDDNMVVTSARCG